jgi:ribosomal protein S18 acetylase RimI-like enzyme
MEPSGFKPRPMSSSHAAFDRALRRRSARLEARAEQPGDLPFLHELAAHCSPIASLLPAPILHQQSEAKEASHRARHPDAMRAIVSVDGVRAGRISVDWGKDGNTHGIDIAVLPEFRASGAGLHMLRAWLDVADSGAMSCTLEVAHDNPAALVYRRLGFTFVVGETGADVPFVRMKRAARPREDRRESVTQR